jgi:hypothetical protein
VPSAARPPAAASAAAAALQTAAAAALQRRRRAAGPSSARPPAALALAADERPPSPSPETEPQQIAAPAPPAPERHVAGAVLEITGPEEYAAIRAAYPQRLVVLMAKARSCRPCKAFSRKYSAVAARFPEAVFLAIYGDDSKESRQMMIALAVRVTPTFRLSRGVDDNATVLTGTSETKLRDAIVAALTEGERADHPDDVEAWRRSRQAAEEAAALEAATAERMSALSTSASAASSLADEG